jgi:hypothetical protein
LDRKTLGRWECGRRIVTDENGLFLRTELVEGAGTEI